MKKLNKAFFFISFLPYAAVILFAVHSSIAGIRTLMFSGNIYYGFDGFVTALWQTVLLNPIIFTILMICLIYQVAYRDHAKKGDDRPIWTIAISAIAISLLFWSCLYAIAPIIFRSAQSGAQG